MAELTDDLDATLVELRLQPGDLAELSRADLKEGRGRQAGEAMGHVSPVIVAGPSALEEDGRDGVMVVGAARVAEGDLMHCLEHIGPKEWWGDLTCTSPPNGPQLPLCKVLLATHSFAAVRFHEDLY